jgi:hypothetical protein
MGPGIGTSAPMDLGIPWAGWQFASSHKTISSSKMLPQNGYLKWIWRHHPYARLYKQAHQIMIEKPPEQHRDVKVQIHLQQGTDG